MKDGLLKRKNQETEQEHFHFSEWDQNQNVPPEHLFLKEVKIQYHKKMSSSSGTNNSSK